MAISIRKTIPSSVRYTGSGDTTVTLNGMKRITMGGKKTLIRTSIPVAPSRSAYATDANSDLANIQIVDTKTITEDTIKISGWLEDDSSESAWNKYWKIRSMLITGGPLTSLIVEDVTFSSSTQQVFLESISSITNPIGDTTIDNSLGDVGEGGHDAARIEIDMTFVLGNSRT